MAVDIKPLLRTGVSLQALALAGRNLAVSKKLLDKKRSQKPLKRITKAAVTNIIGIPLLQTQSQVIGGLP